ncbi:MAG: hypothetical protein GY830_08820 [Bacteroidetes bacterium]|nr:hypothetical protein [Bacteroidota bacterium]
MFNIKSKSLLFLIFFVFVLFNFACKNEPNKKLPKNRVFILNEESFNKIIEDIDKMHNEAKKEISNNKILKLKKLLLKGKVENPKERSYSSTIEYFLEKLSVNHRDFFITCEILAQREKDPINIFTYGETWYAGFESRKKAYIKDKALGINPIHNKLKATNQDNLENKEIYQFKRIRKNFIKIKS